MKHFVQLSFKLNSVKVSLLLHFLVTSHRECLLPIALKTFHRVVQCSWRCEGRMWKSPFMTNNLLAQSCSEWEWRNSIRKCFNFLSSSFNFLLLMNFFFQMHTNPPVNLVRGHPPISQVVYLSSWTSTMRTTKDEFLSEKSLARKVRNHVLKIGGETWKETHVFTVKVAQCLKMLHIYRD